MKSSLYSILLLLVITSCTSYSSLELSNHNWEVVSINNQSLEGTLPYITVNLTEEKINGNTGCNNFFGVIEVVENKLKISPLAATKMMCPDMTNEDLFLKHLNGTINFKFDDNKLLFFKNIDELIMVLTKK